jgi:hypothetical protein
VPLSSSSSSWSRSPIGESVITTNNDNTKNNKSNPYASLAGLLLKIGAIIVTSYVASIILTRLLIPTQGGDEINAMALGNANKRLITLL